ncbi:hypothetical protein D3C87_1995320 [compost metagenome]
MVVDSFGTLELPVLSRFEGTRLGSEIERRLVAFWQQLALISKDDIRFGPLPSIVGGAGARC